VREFDELTDDLTDEERERLRRVHDVLLEAGSMPELPRSLRRAPRPTSQLVRPGRRLAVAAFASGLVLAVVSFAVGYVAADGRDFGHDYSVDMRGAVAAPDASATLDVGERDEAGNWPMVIEVRGLPELPPGGRYLLYLTKKGRPVAWCGSFRVHEGITTVPLNAPYRFDQYDGWVVRADIPGRIDTRPYLVSEKI
jgi:hypothetical protein